MCYFGQVCQLKSRTPSANATHATATRITSRKSLFIPHDPLKRPWSHVAVDLFTFNNKEWLIIVDYWSDYFELNPLPATNASTVITSLKNQFARHGIPDTLYSDNGPQFSSREFQEFATDWQFDHQTSSPPLPSVK